MSKVNKAIAITTAIALASSISLTVHSTKYCNQTLDSLNNANNNLNNANKVIKELNTKVKDLESKSLKEEKLNKELQSNLKRTQEELNSYKRDISFNATNVRELRSEERRVGKECRSRWSPYH